MRERPITLTEDTIERIQAGQQTALLLPVTRQPVRIDDAFDGTWAWPDKLEHRYDDLTMATAIRDRDGWRAGDRLRVYKARGKSHLTVTRLLLELTDPRPGLLPWLSEENLRASGYQGGHDSIPGYQFSATPHEHSRHEWHAHHPDRPWEDAWVWLLEFHPITQATPAKETA